MNSEKDPLVFISHDTRDAEIAFAFRTLLNSVSAGTLKTFIASDTHNIRDIGYGDEWYPTIIEKLSKATDVVCLLTARSLKRPWILFEAGVAKGNQSTNIVGIALGIPLKKTTKGPFSQIKNCSDDHESLTNLVIQLLVERIPMSDPNEDTIRHHVGIFKDTISSSSLTPSEISSQKDYIKIRFKVNIDPSDEVAVNRIVDELQNISDDYDLRVVKGYRGSLILVVEGNKESLHRLKTHYHKSVMLKNTITNIDSLPSSEEKLRNYDSFWRRVADRSHLHISTRMVNCDRYHSGRSDSNEILRIALLGIELDPNDLLSVKTEPYIGLKFRREEIYSQVCEQIIKKLTLLDEARDKIDVVCLNGLSCPFRNSKNPHVQRLIDFLRAYARRHNAVIIAGTYINEQNEHVCPIIFPDCSTIYEEKKAFNDAHSRVLLRTPLQILSNVYTTPVGNIRVLIGSDVANATIVHHAVKRGHDHIRQQTLDEIDLYFVPSFTKEAAHTVSIRQAARDLSFASLGCVFISDNENQLVRHHQIFIAGRDFESLSSEGIVSLKKFDSLNLFEFDRTNLSKLALSSRDIVDIGSTVGK